MSQTPYLRIVFKTTDVGNVKVGVTKTFSITVFTYFGDVTINSIALSNPDYVITSPSFPHLIVYQPSFFGGVLVINGTVTPSAPGADNCTVTINHTGIGDTSCQVTCFAFATGAIVQIDPHLVGHTLGTFDTVKVGSESNLEMDFTNPGDLPYTVSAFAFSGDPSFSQDVPNSDTMPFTVNPGDPPKIFAAKFDPTEVGFLTGVVTFTTDAPAPQDSILVKLAGQSVLLFPISILTGIERGLLFGTSNASKVMRTDFNNPDIDSVLEFNGALWSSLGFEKTLRRVEVYYRNVGACTGLVLILKAFRPTLTLPPKEQTETLTINIGDSTADDSERSQFFDCLLTGEIIIAQLKRTKNTGPCALIAIVPEFEEKGPKVENK